MSTLSNFLLSFSIYLYNACKILRKESNLSARYSTFKTYMYVPVLETNKDYLFLELLIVDDNTVELVHPCLDPFILWQVVCLVKHTTAESWRWTSAVISDRTLSGWTSLLERIFFMTSFLISLALILALGWLWMFLTMKSSFSMRATAGHFSFMYSTQTKKLSFFISVLIFVKVKSSTKGDGGGGEHFGPRPVYYSEQICGFFPQKIASFTIRLHSCSNVS